MKSVADYQNALREMQEARERLDQMVQTTRDVAEKLTAWKTAAPESLNGQLDKAMADWPTGDTILRVFNRWKLASKQMYATWDAIQRDDRIGLVEPHQFVTKPDDQQAK